MMAAPDAATTWRTWCNAAAAPAVDRAIRDIYQRVDDAVAARGPTCWVSGKCCNFDAYGHRMYVTGVEIAWVVAEATKGRHDGVTKGLDKVINPRDVDLAGPCVFQVDGLCSVHAIRPLGCRVFFCQQGTQQWQQDLYEQIQKELRALHDDHALPYQYMEWRMGLKECLEHAHEK